MSKSIGPSELSEDKLFAIKLQYECPYKWSKMKGDDKTRFCNSCQKNVYNISKLSRQKAVELITEKEGNVCVRFYQRRDGTVVTQECSSIRGLHQIRLKYGWLAMANAGLACMANILMPMLGPACVTIVGGVGPIMSGIRDERPRDPECDKVIEPDSATDDE
ncbi:hypothetical protein BH11CYA1_BH11CYA1_29460 [soil metagenome]